MTAYISEDFLTELREGSSSMVIGSAMPPRDPDEDEDEDEEDEDDEDDEPPVVREPDED
jgi:hypothetical protein